jgi:hypothetical protein
MCHLLLTIHYAHRTLIPKGIIESPIFTRRKQERKFQLDKAKRENNDLHELQLSMEMARLHSSVHYHPFAKMVLLQAS